METTADPESKGSEMARTTTPTVADAVEAYLKVRRARFAKDTLINDRSQLRRFAAAMGSRQMHTITPEMVEAFFYTGEDPVCDLMAPSSFNKVVSRVATFIEFCRRRNWVNADLMGEIGRLKVTKRERLRLSPQELIELPSHADNLRDQTLIITAANTALRAGEIGRLRVRDVDLAGGWVRVKIEKSHLEDVMPITAELDVALRVWLTEYADQAGSLQVDWYLFPSRGPGRNRYTRSEGEQHIAHEHGPLKPTEPIAKLALIVQRALRAGGHAIERGEGLHTVRRSVARAFFDANVERGFDAALRATSALLHHSSSQVTEQYLGLSSEKLHRDEVLRGHAFLTAMVTGTNIRPMPSALGHRTASETTPQNLMLMT